MAAEMGLLSLDSCSMGHGGGRCRVRGGGADPIARVVISCLRYDIGPDRNVSFLMDIMPFKGQRIGLVEIGMVSVAVGKEWKPGCRLCMGIKAAGSGSVIKIQFSFLPISA